MTSKLNIVSVELVLPDLIVKHPLNKYMTTLAYSQTALAWGNILLDSTLTRKV